MIFDLARCRYFIIFHHISWYFMIFMIFPNPANFALFFISCFWGYRFLEFFLGPLCARDISTSLERRCRACPRPASWTCPTTNSVASGRTFSSDSVSTGKHGWRILYMAGGYIEGNIAGKRIYDVRWSCLITGGYIKHLHWHDLATFRPVYVQLCESALG